MRFDDILSAPKINIKNIGLGGPCEICDVGWCSIICFQRRGYVWDRIQRFAKDENGIKLRKPFHLRECKALFGDQEEVNNS